MKRVGLRGLAVLGVVLTVGLLAVAAFLATPAPLLPQAAEALRSTDSVEFSDSAGWLSFYPRAERPRVGLIFYPGGRAPAQAYAPAAQAIAAQGYAVFIPPMPFNLAFFDIDRGLAIQQAHPEITIWAIGGHSLGGAMAAEFAARHPGAVRGLVLWASYSATDLSTQNLKVVSIYGSLDANRESFLSTEARANLPADAAFVEINGGNHEQFGYYTGQLNDPVAYTSREDQQAQVVATTLRFLESLAAP
jgi:dienelactone hydrolase